jgi:PAS domain S-box-containing protein
MKFHKKKAVLLLPIFFALALFVTLFFTYQKSHLSKFENSLLLHNGSILLQTERVMSLLKDAETGTRGFVITRQPDFLTPYQQAKDSLGIALQNLEQLTASNSSQQILTATLSSLAERRLTYSTKLLQTPAPPNFNLSKHLILGKQTMDSIRTVVAQIIKNENLQLQKNLQEFKNNQASSQLLFYALFASIILLLICTVIAWQVYKMPYKKDEVHIHERSNTINFFTRRVDDVISGISDPFFAVDFNDKVIFINHPAAALLGITTAEYEGKSLAELCADYTGSPIQQQISKVLQTLETAEFEMQCATHQHYYSFTIYPTAEGVSVHGKNIHDKKLQEQELEKTRQLLEDTNQVALVGGWEIDLTKNLISWTSVTRQIHEVDAQYVPCLDTAINFYKEGESRKKISELVSNAIQLGTAFDTILPIITGLGNEKWVRAKGKTEWDGDKCVRMYGTFQDITDIKLLEIQFEENEKMLERAFETPVAGMVLVNTNGSWRKVNDTFCQMLGYTRQELMSLRVEDITHPEDMADTLAQKEKLLRNPGTKTKFEKRQLHKSGQPVWVEINSSVVLNEQGEVAYFVTQILDISARKKAELQLLQQKELLEIIIDYLPLNVYIKDNQSRKTLVNRMETAYCGYSSKEALLGKSDFELYEKSEADTSVLEDKEVLASGKPMLSKLCFSTNAKGEKRVFLSSKIPLQIENAQYQNLLGISYDITTQHALREELQEKNAELEQFAYIASHDLQEPLRMIKGFVNILEKKYKPILDEEGLKYLGLVADGATRMKLLINEILTYSRCGLTNAQANAVALNDTLTHLCNDVFANALQNGAQIIWQNMPVLYAEETAITQLFTNLIGNGIKYQPGDKKALIYITFNASTGTFGITDNGIGIAKENQHKIFEVFTRLHTRKQYEGTGIGLAICKKIVKAYGGKIWLESEPGKGCTFYFTLPVAMHAPIAAAVPDTQSSSI